MQFKDLKRGMRCTTRSGEVFIVEKTNIEGLDSIYNFINFLESSTMNHTYISKINNDLSNERERDDIIKVEDITLDGYRTIWERPEEKFYLRLPRIYNQASFVDRSYLNYVIDEDGFSFASRTENKHFKTQFTQEEIDDLPRQDFIKTLDRVPVNEEEK